MFLEGDSEERLLQMIPIYILWQYYSSHVQWTQCFVCHVEMREQHAPLTISSGKQHLYSSATMYMDCIYSYKGCTSWGYDGTGTISMYLWTAVWCWWCIWNHHITVHKHIDAVPVQHLHRINHDRGCCSFCRDGGRQDGYYTVTHIYRYF